MKDEDLMKTVYCYNFPEVYEAMDNFDIPRDYYMTTTRPGVIYNHLARLGMDIDVPINDYGMFDADEFNVACVRAAVRYYETFINLSQYNNFYPSAGSSNSIFKLLAYYKSKRITTINCLEGEYEGYRHYAEHLGLEYEEIPRDKIQFYGPRINDTLFIVSNPNSMDGNYLMPDMLSTICSLWKYKILDLSYFGAAKPEFVDEIGDFDAILFSLSKPYGVFRSRMGFTLTKEPIPSMYGNKWFIDTKRMLQMVYLLKRFPLGFLFSKYRPRQKMIIKHIREEEDIPINTSDVLILGYIEDYDRLREHVKRKVAYFRRGKGCRFCLTQYFENFERVDE